MQYIDNKTGGIYRVTGVTPVKNLNFKKLKNAGRLYQKDFELNGHRIDVWVSLSQISNGKYVVFSVFRDCYLIKEKQIKIQ